MSRILKKRAGKLHQPPGTLIYLGEHKTGEPSVSAIAYDEAGFEETLLTELDCLSIRDSAKVTWLNVEGVHSPELLDRLGKCFGLHPLVLEDIMNTDQRPKTEEFEGYIYCVLKMLHLDPETKNITPEQVSIIFGPSFIISFQEGVDGDPFEEIRVRIRADKGRIRKLGADYLAYSLLDAIVDNYFLVLEELGDKIEDIEDSLLKGPDALAFSALHEMKREMLFLRKMAWPLRELVSRLQKAEASFIQDSTRVYLRDAYDHIIQIIDTIETFRDMLSGMIEIYLSSLSNRLNEVMKVLTVVSTLFIPLTFIVGLYGMNFKYMPELEWRWGYPSVLFLMALTTAGMLWYFRRKKWF